MNDAETKRQRHWAEMMLVQCDGKIVQIRNTSDQPWRCLNGSHCDLNPTTEIRIKPEPRECYVCFECFTAFKTYDREAKLCARDHGESSVKKASEQND